MNHWPFILPHSGNLCSKKGAIFIYKVSLKSEDLQAKELKNTSYLSAFESYSKIE